MSDKQWVISVLGKRRVIDNQCQMLMKLNDRNVLAYSNSGGCVVKDHRTDISPRFD